jgi:uncharacterized protein (DUF58 family)
MDVAVPQAPQSSVLDPQHWKSGWRVPPIGRWWLLTTAVLLALGLAKNINLLTLLGYGLLAVFVVNAAAAGYRLRRLRAVRNLAGPVLAGSPCVVEVRLGNSAAAPVTAVRVEDRGADYALGWFAERLEAGGGRALRGEVVLPRRGRYALGPVTAVSGHPFGLVQRWVALTPPGEVIVLPRLGRLQRALLASQLRSQAAPGERLRRGGRAHPAAQEELHGLRTFRTGDSPRAIHWRTSARRDELMVRQFEDLPGDDLLVAFDVSGSAPAESFEAAVSLAASVCYSWCRRKGDRLGLIVAGPAPQLLDGLTGPEHARRLLECLAVVQPSATAELPADLGPARLATRAVLVIAPGPSGLPDALRQVLHRPVTFLDAGRLNEFSFYEPPGRAQAMSDEKAIANCKLQIAN